MRQADLDVLPVKVPMSGWLKERVDEVTAQKVYDELLAKQRQALGDMSFEAFEELSREIMSQVLTRKQLFTARP